MKLEHAMRILVLLLSAVSLSACTGKADPQDVRCYAIGTIEMSNDALRAEDAAFQAFYLGRLDQADPGGRWTEDVIRVLTDEQLETLLADKAACAERMNKAVLKQRNAVAAAHP